LPIKERLNVIRFTGDGVFMPMAMEIGLAFLAPLSELENCLLLVVMLRIPNNRQQWA